MKPSLILNTGTLKKTGAPYTLVLLSPHNMQQILKLQDIIFDHLKPEEQNYVLKKAQDFFENHFKAGGHIIGVMQGDQLIAQSIVVNPTPDHPKTGMVDMDFGVKPEKLTIFQGVIVHPDFRGNGLMDEMMDAWLDLAKTAGRTDAIAEVAVENHYSWNVNLKAGMHIHSIGVDPTDGTVVYNVHGKTTALMKGELTATFNAASVSVSQDDLDQQKQLFAQGYKGVKYDHGKDLLTFSSVPPKNCGWKV